MKIVYISNTDRNADWIKWRTDDVRVSEMAKELLAKKVVKKYYVKK